MAKIIPPKKYADPEFMAAVNFNHLFAALLEEERRLLKEKEPEYAILLPEQVIFHLNAIRDSLSLANQAASIAEVLMAPERDFFRLPETALFTTDVWLFFLALDFRQGQMRMVSDQMVAHFPEIFEPTIVFGRDVIRALTSIEKTLPPGEKIPRQALSILPLIAA